MSNTKITLGAIVLFGVGLACGRLASPSPEAGTQPAPSPVPSLSTQTAPKLVSRWVSRSSVPPATPVAPNNAIETAEPAPVSLLEVLEQESSVAELSPQALARHVERNGSTAESLLAAYRHDGNSNWLHQAAVAYPTDPRVQLKVLASDLHPDDRQQWLESFKQSAPENSLANYLAAHHHLENGDLLLAMQELDAGNQKKQLTAYLMESMQNAEELYVQAGNDPLQAKAKAFVDTEFDHLGDLRETAKRLLQYHDELRTSGQQEAADQLAIMGLQFAQHSSIGEGNNTLIGQLVGLASERAFLERLDPGQGYPSLPMPVPEMLEAVDQQKEFLKQLGRNFQDALDAPPSEAGLLYHYFDRVKIFGEYEAIQWLYQQQQR